MTPRRKPRSAPRRKPGSRPTRRSSTRKSCANPRSAAPQLKGANILEVAKAWQKKKADAGWACLHWPKEYGGRGVVADRARDLAAGRGRVRQALRHVHHRPRHVRPDHDGVRRRGGKAQISAAAGLGRKGLVPVVLRARRRLRRRGPAHPRREERRRLDHQRPEDLDLGRALFRLRHPADPHRSQRAPSTRASPCSSWT